MEEIKQDAGKLLAKELNTKHGAIVYAMAKERMPLPFGTTLKSAKAKLVHNRGCEITVVTCKSDVCEMKGVAYPFRPHLRSRVDFKHRLPSLRNKVCAPKLSWLVTKPVAFMILVICSGLGYGTMFVGYDGIVRAMSKAPRLERGISMVFGSTSMFARYVQGSWYLSVVAHLVEATLAAVGCSTALGLNGEVTMSWFVLIWLVGFPIFQEFNAMMNAQQAAAAAKAK